MTEYLVVKDFEKFQHYKDREPPWIKLHRSLLRNYEFIQLPETAQVHLIKIWLLASQIGNKIPYDTEFIAREISAKESDLIQNLFQIFSAGFLVKLKKNGRKPLKQKEKPASGALATCKQNAMPETEAETETKKTKQKAFGFDEFWEACPKKVGKIAAEKAFAKATLRASAADITSGMKRHAAYWERNAVERKWIKDPATWLNAGCWMDELDGDASTETENYYEAQLRLIKEREQKNVVHFPNS